MSAQSVEIVVRGRIGTDVAAALDGFTVTVAPDPAHTRVVGPVPDQAKLLGLLAMLDDLHLEVVSVNRVRMT